ncbi:hypothetical protein R4282_30915 [Rhodococcus oxybenzonivorans]|uniref:hypothetical protein n=1 Tax=Rhodococcus oxybenzonivorans TaxID=1990687 RepID=UPI0029537CE6|nr:hypothetical protein [Rhodococcus oxybenzonivorans]MDV7357416.1 hypothetical protein [Rhodococcus oxybenzonivorans]
MGKRWNVLERPTLELADQLRSADHSELAEGLRNAVPANLDQGPSDSHFPELRARLVQVVDKSSADEELRRTAQKLIEVIDDLPTALGRCGIVHITWQETKNPRIIDPDPPHYSGHWNGSLGRRDPEPDHVIYQNAPQFGHLSDALEWARRRSSRVFVRPAWDPGNTYWAGDDTSGHTLPGLEEPS